MPETQRALDGILVVDLATTRAELAGRLLGELGATVIKVEPPAGAEARRLPPFDERPGPRSGESLYWAAVGTGKRSVVLDPEVPAQRDALLELIARSDVLIESANPGVMASRGLGYEDLSRRNPRLVYVSVTPYGQDGPDAHSPAADLTLEAAGGLVALQGDGDRPPVPIGFPQASFHAGVQAAADAVIALNERENSGLGQYLDVSMQAAVVWTLMNATGYPKNTGGDPPFSGDNRMLAAPSVVPGVELPKIWACKDGYVTCTIAGGRTGKAALQTALSWVAAESELPLELLEPDWSAWALDVASGKLSADLANRAIAAVADFFTTRTKHELMQLGTEGGLLLAPVYAIDDLLTDPQLASRQYWREVEGRTVPGEPVRLSRTPLHAPRPAPALGADQDMLAELLGRPVERPRASSSSRRRTFEGLKVADFSWIGVGPIMAKALADHGATVVHVEHAARPDLLRTIPPFKDNIKDLDRAQFMANFNSSKLGLSLNLASEAGRELSRELIRWSDVVLESFTAGAFERLGFDYETLSREQPDLVMMSTCLRGQTGPQRAFGGYGGQGAALAGIYGLTGWPDRPPCGPWGAYTDFIAPRYGVAAIGSALLHRRKTGLGQRIDLSQVEAGIHFIEPMVLDYTVNGRIARAPGHESWYASPHGVYAVRGIERYIAIACETAEQWRALRAVAPLEPFSDERFDDLAARRAVDAELDAVLSGWLRDLDGEAVVEELKQAGVPAARVLRTSELYDDRQLEHRGFFVTCEHTVMGPTPYDGPVTTFSATPPQLVAAPCLGEHQEQVLRDILGLSPEAIDAFASRGAF